LFFLSSHSDDAVNMARLLRELGPEAKFAISHRGAALRALLSLPRVHLAH
jgi:inosine/xanthosine triphosphate pyrophosphatase family protein